MVQEKKLSWFLLPARPCLPPRTSSVALSCSRTNQSLLPGPHPAGLLHFVRHLPGAWPLANDFALRCAPGYIKAETRSGGAFVIPHDTCSRTKERAVRNHSRPHRASRHGAGGACDTLSLHLHHTSGTLYPEIIINLTTW